MKLFCILLEKLVVLFTLYYFSLHQPPLPLLLVSTHKERLITNWSGRKFGVRKHSSSDLPLNCPAQIVRCTVISAETCIESHGRSKLQELYGWDPGWEATCKLNEKQES